MVAKINRSDSLFGALIYNKNKVDEQTARVISANRVIPEGMQNMMSAFENYLIANKRTEKPILHISLNPHPEDNLTDAQFAALADEYMDRMGYGNQPYVVFMHEDTGRRHVHIVSTCVDENGKRISDKYEFRKSMNVCRELEQKYGLVNSAERKYRPMEPRLRPVDTSIGDVKKQILNTLKGVLSHYKFQSFGEYSALLASFNIEAKQVRGEHDGTPWSGVIYVTNDGQQFKSSLFGKQFGIEELNKKMRRHAMNYKQKKWQPKIHDTVRLAMISCMGDSARFEKNLRKKGLDVVSRRNDEGRIYGVTFIDHNAREVYNGSRLGKDFSANAFEKLFNVPTEKPHENITTSPEIPGIYFGESHDPEPPDDQIIQHKKKKKRRYISR